MEKKREKDKHDKKYQAKSLLNLISFSIFFLLFIFLEPEKTAKKSKFI